MTKDIVTLHVYTKHGTHTIPNVNLSNYKFDKDHQHNPCLQVINESFNVLSVSWHEITHIEAARPVKKVSVYSDVSEALEELVVSAIEGKPPIETIWRSDA